MADPMDAVTVYRAANITEAHFVKNLLLEEEIEAEVAEENEPLAGLPITPPDVMVRRADEARALGIIKAYEDEQIRLADRPEWECPSCHATVIGAFDLCDSCGAERPGLAEEEEPVE